MTDVGAARPRPEHRLLPSLVVVALVGIPFVLPAAVFPRALVGVAPLTIG